jgi:glycosyltransferase-like protein
VSRIGIFTYSTRPRGSVVHAACLGEALTRAGYDVTLFALDRGQGFYRELACKSCLLPAAEAPPELDRLIQQRIAELVRGLTAAAPALDLLHAQDCLVSNALLELRAAGSPGFAQRPLLRTVHHVERFESAYLLDCQRRSILEADQLLTVSQATAQAVRAEFGRDSQRVPNGVDSQRFRPLPPRRRSELRQRLGLGAQQVLVLSVGGVEPRKNSLRLLAAFAALVEAGAELVWTLLGGASILDHRAYREQFETQLAQLSPRVRERIRRPGAVSELELEQWYQASDVLACASEQEGWGLCVLEAMAAELPVLVSDRPPFTEYVTAQAGVLVDPEDASALQRALAELATDPERRQRLGAAGRAIAARHSWSRSAALHAEIYQRAPAGRAINQF